MEVLQSLVPMPIGFCNKPILFSLFSQFSIGVIFGKTLARKGVGQYSQMSWRASQPIPAKIESKTMAIRNQYKTELNQEIGKLKAEWAQENLKTNEQHNAQISQVLKEVEVLKEQSHSQPKAETNEPGDKISGLKATAFNFMPGMVNTLRGGAVNIHNDTILWSKNDNAPPIPPRKQDEKHVHFTSTPHHPVQSNLFDSDDENP